MANPPPSISGDAIIKALGPDGAAARSGDLDRERAALDESELREIERAEYYHDVPSETDAVPEVAPRRSLLDRLFHR